MRSKKTGLGVNMGHLKYNGSNLYVGRILLFSSNSKPDWASGCSKNKKLIIFVLLFHFDRDSGFEFERFVKDPLIHFVDVRGVKHQSILRV